MQQLAQAFDPPMPVATAALVRTAVPSMMHLTAIVLSGARPTACQREAIAFTLGVTHRVSRQDAALK